jgi:hypothetical protein
MHLDQFQFTVKRSFTTASGRECALGSTVELRDAADVRRLMSLGFITPAASRTMDHECMHRPVQGRGGRMTPRASKFYTRGGGNR